MLTLGEQVRLEERNEQLERKLLAHKRRLQGAHQEKNLLRRQLEALKFKLFGSPRCEKITDEQLLLALEQLKREEGEQVAAGEEIIAYTRRKPRTRPALARIPADIVVVRKEIIREEVKADPDAYERIGEEVTEELDIIPGRLIKRMVVRPKFKRRDTLDAVPFVAALPGRIVPGGMSTTCLCIGWRRRCASAPAAHVRLDRLGRPRWGRGAAVCPVQEGAVAGLDHGAVFVALHDDFEQV